MQIFHRLWFLLLGWIVRSDRINGTVTLIYLKPWSGDREVYCFVGSMVINIRKLDWRLLAERAGAALHWESNPTADPATVRNGRLYRTWVGVAWQQVSSEGSGLAIVRRINVDGTRQALFRFPSGTGDCAENMEYPFNRRDIRQLVCAVKRALAWRDGGTP